MKKNGLLLIAVLLNSVFSFSQVTYEGPVQGWITSGVMVSTDDFSIVSLQNEPMERVIKNLVIPGEEPLFIDFPTPSPEHVYVEDPNINGNRGFSGGTMLLQDFAGIGMTNSIPPDPTIAAGPNHVVACVNNRFTIWDKEGNLMKNINAELWYTSVLALPGPFDPQIFYDHYAGRWFMLWDSQSDNPQRSHFLVSVSDDDNPIGIWYNYALPANQNGMTVVSNWSDFPQIGFDEEAIYINSRQFTFTGFKVYDKIRILNKSQLYAADGDSVYWTDIWDITYPHITNRLDVIRPTIQYSPSSRFYLIHTIRSGGNFISLYWITNPLTTPVLQGANINVPVYGTAPNANQLGGGLPLIEANGSGQKSASIFRDGFIWVINAIQNPTSPQNAALVYYKINPSTNSIEDNFVFGAANYWYIFPAITVDKDHNVAVTYSRSATTEYIGGYYSGRLANDPPGFDGSTALKEGQGNYVVTFGSGRNRWGDYLGIFLDPVDEYSIWIFPEYAAATNTWGTWVGEIRIAPIIPVELVSFNARILNNTVHLSWITATELNNQGFEIERLKDYKITRLQDWEKIGFVEGKGTTTETQLYSFIDENLEPGSYIYRIKQIDFDGSFDYSHKIEVEIGMPEEFSLSQNYPNPFNPTTNITFSLPVDTFVSLKVFNLIGQEVAEIINANFTAGNYTVPINGFHLTSGLYFYTLNAAGTGGKNFNSTRKMMVIK